MKICSNTVEDVSAVTLYDIDTIIMENKTALTDSSTAMQN